VGVAIVGVAGVLSAAIFVTGRRHVAAPATLQPTTQSTAIPEPPLPSALPALVAPPASEVETGISVVDAAAQNSSKAPTHPPTWRPPGPAKSATSVHAPSSKDDPFQNRNSF
jgi:hypothetical protein